MPIHSIESENDFIYNINLLPCILDHNLSDIEHNSFPANHNTIHKFYLIITVSFLLSLLIDLSYQDHLISIPHFVVYTFDKDIIVISLFY